MRIYKRLDNFGPSNRWLKCSSCQDGYRFIVEQVIRQILKRFFSLSEDRALQTLIQNVGLRAFVELSILFQFGVLPKLKWQETI